MQRRQFLGAAAALATLPATASATDTAEPDDTDEQTEWESPDPTYLRGDTHTQSVFLELYDDDGTGNVQVNTLVEPDQHITLEVQLSIAELGVGLDAEVARSLGQELIEAADAVEEHQ